MSDLRSQLKTKGWRQGVILSNDSVDLVANRASEFAGYLVLTQTCDCLNDKFEKEPYLELLPLSRVEAPDKQLMNGRNPRKIQFEIVGGSENMWVEASIHDIFTIDRREHEKLVFADFRIEGSSIESLIAWRAARYLRIAFPDTFVTAFCKISSRFGKKIKRNGHHELIESLLISLEPFEELAEVDGYEIQILLMVRPEDMANTENAEKLKTLSDDLTGILESSKSFVFAECKVVGLHEMTLLQREKYLDFTDYDYLSFGD